jgi:phosphoribosylformylglycinamidine synthase
MEKLLLEACLELMQTDALVAIQDMGAAGLTCSSCEMGARGDLGIEIDLDKVPQRERGMTPYEILLSESQERMLLVAKAGREREVEAIFDKWDLHASTIGRVTTDGLLRVLSGSKTVALVPNKVLTDEGPVYERPMATPDRLRELRPLRVSELTEPQDLERTLLTLVSTPTVASKHWVFEQYDHMVRSDTITFPGSDAGVIRIKGTKLALAMCLDGNGRYTSLDPYIGGAIAVAEGCRNLSATGAIPIGATNCLNFGNPEKPEIMWEFARAIDGMRDACQRLDVPITGGNVSFYNETEGEGIFPTPVVGVVGLLADRAHRLTHCFKQPGDHVYLVGETAEELGGSEYLKSVHGRVDGIPPRLDLVMECAVQELVRTAASKHLLNSAHDCSDGGLGVALVESCFGLLGERIGVRIALETPTRADAVLFSESQSRILVSVPADRVSAWETLAEEAAVPVSRLGVTGGDVLSVRVNGIDAISLDVDELRDAWWTAIENRISE